MKLKVLVFTSTFPRWQGDTLPEFVWELTKRLQPATETFVLAPSHTGAKKRETWEGIKIRRFRYLPKRWEKLTGPGGILANLRNSPLYVLSLPFFFIASAFALRSMIRQVKPDIVHAHWVIPQGLVTFLVSKLTRTPFVVTVHGSDIFCLDGRLLRALKKAILQAAAEITVVSPAIHDHIRHHISTTVNPLVIPMGVDTTLFNPCAYDKILYERLQPNSDGKLLLFVGRLAHEKGPLDLIQAMGKIIAKAPKTRLVIIGAGPLEKDLKYLAYRKGIEATIEFVGSKPPTELAPYVATADLVVGPSLSEGFGLIFVEALSSGTPVVATDLPAIRRIVNHEVNGILVSPGDPDELSGAVLGILDDPKLLEDLRAGAVREVSENDWQTVTDKFIELFSRAAKNR